MANEQAIRLTVDEPSGSSLQVAFAALAPLPPSLVHSLVLFARTVRAMPAPPSSHDPLLALIFAYRHGLAIHAALPAELHALAGEAVANATWRKSLGTLLTAPPRPTTAQGAVEAVRCVRDEIHTQHGAALAQSVLGAVLTHFDRRILQ